MPQQTAPRSVTCKRLHSNARMPANNSRPSPTPLPRQQQPLPQQLSLPRDSPLAHAAAWPAPAAQTPMINGRKRLLRATVAPASRLSEPSLSSKRKQQLVVDRQRPSRRLPARLDSMPCHVQVAQAATSSNIYDTWQIDSQKHNCTCCKMYCCCSTFECSKLAETGCECCTAVPQPAHRSDKQPWQHHSQQL